MIRSSVSSSAVHGQLKGSSYFRSLDDDRQVSVLLKGSKLLALDDRTPSLPSAVPPLNVVIIQASYTSLMSGAISIIFSWQWRL